MKGSAQAERGISTVVVLFSLTIVVLLGSYLSSLGSIHLGRVSRQRLSTMAFYAAEAGVARALYDLQVNPDLQSQIPSIPLSSVNAIFSLRLMNNVDGSNDIPGIIVSRVPPGAVEIVSTGRAGSITQRVGVVAYRGTKPFDYAAFARSEMEWTGNASSDSFDSNQGAYSETVKKSGGSIGSNANDPGADGDPEAILISGSASINGKVGVAKSPPETYIRVTDHPQYGEPTGTVAVVPSKDFSVVLPPSGLQVQGGDMVFQSSENVVLPPGEYNSLTINGSARVTLTSGVYYFRQDVSVGGDASPGQQTWATISIDASHGPVVLYFGDDFEIKGGAVVNGTLKSTNFQVYGAGRPGEGGIGSQDATHLVSLKGGAQAYLAVYAPTALVKVEGTADVYGSVIGERVLVTASGAIHYDRALSNVTVPTPNKFTVKAWISAP